MVSPEPGQRVADAGLHGAQGAADQLGDLRVGVTAEVRQLDHPALRCGETRELLPQASAVDAQLGLGRGVAAGRRGDRRHGRRGWLGAGVAVRCGFAQR